MVFGFCLFVLCVRYGWGWVATLGFVYLLTLVCCWVGCFSCVYGMLRFVYLFMVFIIALDVNGVFLWVGLRCALCLFPGCLGCGFW